MKFLFLLEGKNDLIFLKEIIANNTHSSISPIFYSNRGNKSSKKNQETDMLRNLCSYGSNYNLLVKEEEGRSVVINLFINLVVNFLPLNNNLCATVLFDHDSRDPDVDIQSINNNIKSRTSGKFGFEPASSKKRIVEGFYRRDFLLFLYGGQEKFPKASFSFATFDTSLEKVLSKRDTKEKDFLIEKDLKRFGSAIDFQDLINCDLS